MIDEEKSEGTDCFFTVVVTKWSVVPFLGGCVRVGLLFAIRIAAFALLRVKGRDFVVA
jgi:hypothetical protein